MREARKESRRPYGFLVDRDVAKAKSLFPQARAYTLADVGLKENARDAEIVAEAWQRELTVVTANGDDFFREILRFQRQTKRNECHEMWGLVVLPNDYETQRRLVPQIRRRLRFGNRRAAWKDVSDKNLCVRVKKDGRLEITRFPRCFYCQKNETERAQ